MILWLACFGAASIIIEMVAGLMFWMLLALRFWWLILIVVAMYYLYLGVTTLLGTYAAVGDYWHYVWPCLIGGTLRGLRIHYHAAQQPMPPIIRHHQIE